MNSVVVVLVVVVVCEVVVVKVEGRNPKDERRERMGWNSPFVVMMDMFV